MAHYHERYTTADVMRLIEDLVPIILDAADSHNQLDLSRFALISSQWLWPARKRLYASPSIHTYQSCGLLARTLHKNADLQPLIHAISLDPAIPVKGRNVGLDLGDWASIFYVLGLHSVRALTLGGGLVLFGTHIASVIDNFRNLHALHVDGSALQHIATFDWDRTIASQLASLTHLTLSKLRLIIAYPTNVPPLRLTHLTFDDVMIFPGDLHHLCHDSWNTLRHLRIVGHTDLDTNEELRATLRSCVNLVSFEYEARGAWEHGAIYDDRLPVIPSLRKLVLINVSFTRNSLQRISHSFRNLEELVIAGRRSYRISLDEWLDALREDRFPSLRILSTPRPVEGSSLQHCCINRNVILRRFIA